ncbi:Uncharacterized protein SVXHr_1685 [Halorhabdus sp. SVX81]|uniref:hypothetical protein n=1 Tax=Halorhabdus sp. SVX81 TaxID=2978283 RepID=UPI0023DC9902|nr:hypothetical protein [Halorhabdus sp. SVX81]WEL17852.1 Uncharacterized protein SVXHr_1685 [Halorhabdus sp. SVX81]
MTTDDAGIVGEALLTETGSGGLLRDGYLAETPLESHLDSREQPQVVFATDASGVRHESPKGQTTHEPGSGYRTLVALTTHRVVLVVGGATDDGGDHPVTIPLTDIDHVAASTGFRKSTVRFWIGDHVWEISPETTDAETVETYLSKASQRRIRFERLLGEAEDAIVDAARDLRNGQFESATAALDQAADRFDDVREAVEAFPADVPAMQDRVRATYDRYRKERRRLLLARAERKRERARTAWRGESYERAADTFERAREICEALLDRDELPDEARAQVLTMLSAIDRDLDRLAVAPMQVARVRHRAAVDASLPGEAAEHWRAAFDRYRTVLELDWGRAESRFAGGNNQIKARLATVADELLAARSRAADQHRAAAIRLTRAGASATAREAYAEASEHLQAAIEIARELDPDAVDGLRSQLRVLEGRIERLPAADSESTQAADQRPRIPTETTTAIRPFAGGDRQEILPVRTHQVLPAVHRQYSDGDSILAIPAPSNGADVTLAVHRPVDNSDGALAIHRPAHDGEGTLAIPRSVRESHGWYVRRLRTLDAETLLRRVRWIWRNLGWTIDRPDPDAPELLATRSGVQATLRLRVRCHGDPVDSAVVSGIAHGQDRPEHDPWPVLVTTDPVDPAAFKTAISAGVTIVDRRSLGELWYRTDDPPEHADRPTPRQAAPPS